MIVAGPHSARKEPARRLPNSNQRFYPSKRTIRSNIYKAVIRERFSKFDQENLQKKVELWQSKCPDETFLFRPLVHYSEETNCAEDEDTKDNEEEDDNEDICQSQQMACCSYIKPITKSVYFRDMVMN